MSASAVRRFFFVLSANVFSGLTCSRFRRFALSESLIRMLLSIDIIQPGLMEALLDRILGYLNEG